MIAADGLPGIPATLDAASGPDTVGEVAEITHLLPHLRHWPPGLRVFARRVKPLRDTTPKPLPGTGQLELDLQTRAAGWRYEAFATNAAPTQPAEHPHEVTAWLDGRHRVHARVEDHFRVGNDTGADRLPSQHFAVNAAWQRTHAIACDLIAWLRLLGCDDALARTEPATLQYRIFHAPAILTRGGRRRRLNFPPHWPWTGHIQAIFTRLLALPAPTRNPHPPSGRPPPPTPENPAPRRPIIHAHQRAHAPETSRYSFDWTCATCSASPIWPRSVRNRPNSTAWSVVRCSEALIGIQSRLRPENSRST